MLDCSVSIANALETLHSCTIIFTLRRQSGHFIYLFAFGFPLVLFVLPCYKDKTVVTTPGTWGNTPYNTVFCKNHYKWYDNDRCVIQAKLNSRKHLIPPLHGRIDGVTFVNSLEKHDCVMRRCDCMVCTGLSCLTNMTHTQTYTHTRMYISDTINLGHNRIWWLYKSTLVEWYEQLVLLIDHWSLGASQCTNDLSRKPHILES